MIPYIYITLFNLKIGNFKPHLGFLLREINYIATVSNYSKIRHDHGGQSSRSRQNILYYVLEHLGIQ